MPRLRHSLTLLLLTAACSGGGRSEPATTPSPSEGPVATPAPPRVALATGYDASAIIEHRDSVFIALPDGTTQVQVAERHVRFTVRVAGNGDVEVQLDSMAGRPAVPNAGYDLLGATWHGRLTRDGLDGLSGPADETPLGGHVAAQVAMLFPAVPRGGASVGERWADTTGSDRRVEIFRAADQRRALWEVGEPVTRDGIETVPVSVREEYEQLGRGEQAGREMRMTAQGVRSATYYVSIIGRIDGMVARDSAQRLITIPSTRQAIPTTQVVRTEIRWEFKR